jgi:hypothetical protein
MVELKWARSIQEIRNSLTTFNVQAKHNKKRGRSLARQTTYWIYDSRQKAFGPNKFVAYKNMTCECYESALKRPYYGARHNGKKARENIERVLGKKYVADPQLHGYLVRWAEPLFGPGVLDGVSDAKWRFVHLPEE